MDRQGGLCLRRSLEWLLQCDGLCRQRQLLPALCRSVTLSRPRRIVQTGRSSMNILVTVRSGTIASTLLNQLTECLMIFVATDANGRPMAGSRLDVGNRGGSSAPDGSASAE